MTNLKAINITADNNVSQGDIYKRIKYSYIDEEDDASVDIIELEFPFSVVISQSCDVDFMSKMIQGETSTSLKFMPSILLCPIYHKDDIEDGKHLKEVLDECKINISEDKMKGYYTKRNREVAENKEHLRFLPFNIQNNQNISCQLDNLVIDYKHVFSVPMKYLINCRNKRICKLDSLSADLVANGFAAYISRIGVPDV